MSKHKNLLDQAWILAGTIYKSGDIHRFMENAHPTTLGLNDYPARRLMSPEDLINTYGQDGFDIVKRALTRQPEPA